MFVATGGMPVCLRVGLFCGLCIGWLALPEPAFAVDAAQRIELATQRAEALELSAMGWRLAIAVSALLLVAFPLLSKRLQKGRSHGQAHGQLADGGGASVRHKASRVESVRVSALLLLALASYASYYDFFRPSAGVGFKDTDVFHYYMASKYFSQVGYFDLYHCTLLALTDSGVESRFDLPGVRDMRTLRIHTPDTALAAARQCRKQFSDELWREFADDIDWFEAKFQAEHWHILLRDHGYNPTPVWNVVGGALTSRVPLPSAAFDWLIRTDRILIVVGFGLIAWAFSFEVAALSAIVWGTGHHWSYAWIGDSLLRNLWLFAVIAGLCFLKRKRDFLAGAFLSFASLLRLFPAIFVAGFALRAWLDRRKQEAWSPSARRFALGVLSLGSVLLLWAAVASDWGPVAYLEFSEKMSVFRDQESLNKLGLSSLVWRVIMMATGHLVTGSDGNAVLTPYAPSWLPFVVRGVQLVVLLPALLFFWRAVSRARNWEAAALGFALIPLLSDPANYYFGFVICGVLLAAERPRLQVCLLVGATLWIANGICFYRVPEEYLGAGIIAVFLPLAVLYEMSERPGDRPFSGGAAIVPGHSDRAA